MSASWSGRDSADALRIDGYRAHAFFAAGRSRRGIPLALAIAFLAIGVFAFDTLSSEPIAAAPLYVVVILAASGSARRGWVVRTSAISIVLTLLGYLLEHDFSTGFGPIGRCLLSIFAIVVATVLILRVVAATRLMFEQAQLLDQTHGSVTVRAVDGTVTYWNQGATALYGWSADEARGVASYDLLASELPACMEELHEHLFRDGFWEGEIVNLAKDGRRITVDVRWLLLRDDSGKPFSILETANDITRRKRADDALRLSAARYQKIFDSTGVAIWESDFSSVKNKISNVLGASLTEFSQYCLENPSFIRGVLDSIVAIDANDASVVMFAAESKAQVLGKHGWMWPVDSEPVFANALFALIDGQSHFESETVMVTRTGRRMDVIFTAVFIMEVVGKVSVYIAIADVSARNQAKTALHEAQIDLAHASRLTSLGELTSAIAHEVNQPLGAIVANGQAGLRWLQRERPEIEAAVVSLNDLVEEAKRAAGVVAGIRSLGRRDAPELEVTELNGLVTETLVLLARDLDRMNVTVSADVAEPLAIVRANVIQLQQVVINLMMNAAQAMTDTDVDDRRITVTMALKSGCAVVSVVDTGPGIRDDMRDRLFAAFATDRSDGMGLGLSVCSSILRRHGGAIWSTYEGNAGGEFHFSLPLHQQGDEP